MNIFECEMLARYLWGIGEDVDEVCLLYTSDAADE